MKKGRGEIPLFYLDNTVKDSTLFFASGVEFMGYRQVKRKSKNCIMIDQYMSAKHRVPGEKRAEKRNITPEDLRKRNLANKRKKTLWRMNTYFEEGDIYATLTYRKEDRPEDMEEAKMDFKRFREKLRKVFKKKGLPFRWIRNIEVGTRNSWHVHLVIKKMEGLEGIITRLWKKHGKVQFQIMTEDGGFRKLADYICKTKDTDTRLRETDFDSSRNMPLPDPEVKDIKSWSIDRKIVVPEGWYLDMETLREGVNPITGYKFRSYILLRDRSRERSG